MKILEDLLDCFQLYAVCTDCERMEQLQLKQMIDQFGSNLTIDSVRRRLRCGQCRQRTEDIRIVYVGEQGKLSGFHYQISGTQISGTQVSELRDSEQQAVGLAPAPTSQPFSNSVDSSVSPNPSTPT